MDSSTSFVPHCAQNDNRKQLRKPLRLNQRLKTGDNIEEFLVNAALTQLVKRAVERFQQVVNVFIGALHGSQTAGIFSGQRFGAAAKKRDEKVAADERLQRRGVAANDFGQVLAWPRARGEFAAPIFVKWQQALADRFINRAFGRAIVKNVQFADFIGDLVFFTRHQNLPDERRDALHRIRHGEKTGERQSGIGKTRMNALSDGPDFHYFRAARQAF